MLDAFATALAEVFALADAEGLDAAIAVRLAVVMVPGLTVATAVGVLFSDRCGAGGVGGCLRARSAGARGCGGAREAVVAAPPDMPSSASSSVAPKRYGGCSA